MWNINKLTDKENNLVVTRGMEGGGWAQGVQGHIFMVFDKYKCATEISQFYKLFRPELKN